MYYVRRGQSKPRLNFSRINGPIELAESVYSAVMKQSRSNSLRYPCPADGAGALEYPFSFPERRSSWPAPRIDRFQSVLVTDWSDDNTVKKLTGSNRKRMTEGILFSVCRTCNRYIISKNHPLDLFGEKAIRKESYGIEKSFLV